MSIYVSLTCTQVQMFHSILCKEKKKYKTLHQNEYTYLFLSMINVFIVIISLGL